jgi:hypothetical protein
MGIGKRFGHETPFWGWNPLLFYIGFSNAEFQVWLAIMYKVIPHKVLFMIIAWLIFGCVLAINSVNQMLNTEWFRPTQAVAIGWLIISALVCNPVWRFFWRKFPKLNQWVFPDLNGTWDVEMTSNWSIHRKVADAAAGKSPSFDVEQCPEGDLPALLPVQLKAEISQTWFSIDIMIWNPRSDTPIKRSDVISADPFGAVRLKPSGLFYFFKQQNDRLRLADENEFYGAARVEYSTETETLRGLFWTARMWGRAMNTAGDITYRRSP